MGGRYRPPCLSIGERAGGAAIALAAVLGAADPGLAAVPLTLFVLACCAAPFFPALNFFLPVVTRGTSSAGGVALTFDDGPDPGTTPLLLNILNRYGVHATFFVTGKRAKDYPALMDAICRSGHDVGNHSYSHDMLLMLRGRKALELEIDRTQAVLTGLGVDSTAFRPPVGIVGPHLGPVLRRRGMFAVTYSCRALDRGNRRVTRISRRILGRVRPGDIIVLHDTTPPDAALLPVWEKQIESVLAGLARKQLPVLPLSRLLENRIRDTDCEPRS
ncbi:MAG: polysaccharide deacetylase family protein [Pseudomonadota bacterium]